MSENTNSNEKDLATLTAEGLTAYAIELEDKVKELEKATERVGELVTQNNRLSLEWLAVQTELNEYYEQGEFSDSTAFGQYLIETFEIETEEEVEITYRASWSRTISIPKGFDLDELELDRELPDDLKITINSESHYLGRDSAEFEY